MFTFSCYLLLQTNNLRKVVTYTETPAQQDLMVYLLHSFFVTFFLERPYKTKSQHTPDYLIKTKCNGFWLNRLNKTLIKSSLMYFLIYCGFLNDEKISSEAVAMRCSVKKVLLEISQDSQENTCSRVSLLRETLAQVFSCKFCEISENIFFSEHVWWLLLSVFWKIFLKIK